MSIPTIRISGEDAVGRNLQPDDLFWFSEVDPGSPTGYASKSITGQEIINGSVTGSSGKNFSQTEWKTTVPVGISIPNGADLNLLSLFDNLADKFANGTTAYNEYNIMQGGNYIPLTFTGTSGSGEVKINGINDYITTFNTDENQTAEDFGNIEFLLPIEDGAYQGGNVVWMFYTGPAPTIIFTNTGGDLNVAIGVPGVAQACIKIPYVGEPYEGQRLTHNARVALNISTGSIQVLELTFRRCSDDSVIASGTTIHRNQDITGQLASFLSYTYGELDDFVQTGFYVNIRNDSGVTINLEAELDFLIVNNFEQNVIFP